MTGFDMNLRENFIKKLCQKYSFVKCGTLGKSLCNRDIHYLKIGSNDNPALFAAAFHGMEWLTSLLVLNFTESISEAIYKDGLINGIKIGNFLSRHGLIVVPCVNPDGVEISLNGAQNACSYENLVDRIMNYGSTVPWQANARGVDLNHNFNANWYELHQLEEKNGIIGPAPTRYGGPAPASEPETRALVDFCERFSFRHVIAFHSQGEEIYWQYGTKTPQKAERMALKIAELSGYKLSAPEGLAVGGGFKDRFIEEFAKPGFTVEIGKGKNPLPLSDIVEIYDKLESMMIYCSIV